MRLIFSIAFFVALSSCGAPKGARYSRIQAQSTLKTLEKPGLVLGTFKLAPGAVVDGDTIKVFGLKSTLRLLAIDTEETFKNDEDRRMAATDFKKYLLGKRRKKGRPAKAGTPLGEDAKKWAEKFFDGVSEVKLERDHPKEIRGRFNRYLTYVFAKKNGEWVNYNVECVRAGMSPYFTKYSYSRRFHEEFVKAEDEARAAKRGIWAPDAEAYFDYDLRKVWWDARADFIKKFEEEAKSRDDLVVLTNWDSLQKIEDRLGQEIEILATVGDIKLGDRGPTRVQLSRRMQADFPLVFFDKDVFGSSRIEEWKGEYVRVRGTVSEYRPKGRDLAILQMVVKRPGQINRSNLDFFEKEGGG